MGVLIKGIEMPKTCLDCFACHVLEDELYCEPLDTELKLGHCGRLADCPLVPVTPHDGEAFEKVILERIAQIEKWGDEPCNHPFEWMSILGEEFGELCEAVNETCFMNGTHPERGGDENIIREATQIAAVAVAIIRDFSPTIIPAEDGET